MIFAGTLLILSGLALFFFSKKEKVFEYLFLTSLGITLIFSSIAIEGNHGHIHFLLFYGILFSSTLLSFFFYIIFTEGFKNPNNIEKGDSN